MDPELWQRANDLFQAILQHAPVDRAAFLTSACGSDDELRRFVERLVLAHERAGAFLDSAATLNVRRLVASGSGAFDRQLTLPSYQTGPQFRGTDRFAVRRQLGSGGMGVVYEVLDRARDEIVALKTMKRARPGDIYRLKREFRSLVDVAHPNLVSLYELVIDATTCFFTMELVNGVHFVDDVNSSNLLDGRSRAERVRDGLRQLVDGIAALHRRGKLHRDIKPSNILVTHGGRVVILDFGLSSDVVTDSVVMSERMAGTPAYFAPERHAGAAPSESQDWYSIGVTLYQALTGRVPFEGTLAEALRRQREGDPVPPRSLSRETPEDLDAICVGLLRRDPARRFTDRDVRQALQRGLSQSADTTKGEEEESTFVGRREHLAALRDAWRAAKQGRAVTVYVHGSSGIGKSALIEWFLQDTLSLDPAVVLRGRCYEHESVPYKALDGVIDSLRQYLLSLPGSDAESLMPADAGALARLFPVLAGMGATSNTLTRDETDPVVLRQRAFAALRELFTRLASRQLVVAYIDDLHWADADSALLLADLLRPPDAPPMLIITCARTEEVASKPFLASLFASTNGHVVLPLESMNAVESRALIESTLQTERPVTNDEIDAITHEGSGNPFLLRQLTRYASMRPAWRAKDRTFAELLLEPISALPSEAWPFLQMLAICGRPMPTGLVFEAAGLGRGERTLLRRLRASHFVRSSGSADRIEVYHDRIRETIVTSIAADARRRLHASMARAMQARQIDDPEALYEHHREAGDLAAASVQAAAAARKGDAALAFDRAAAYYQAALELAPAAAASPAWQEALAGALANAGRPVAAADAYLTAASVANAPHRVELHRRAAEHFLLGGHIDRGLQTMGSVLRTVGMRLPRTPRRTVAALAWSRAALRWRGLTYVERPADRIPAADLLRIDTCWSVASGLALVDSLRAAHFQTRCLLLALDAGDPYRIVRSMAAEVGFAATAGRRSQRSTAALAQRIQKIAVATESPHAIALTTLATGIAAFMVGQWRDSTKLCGRALEMFHEQITGVLWEAAMAQRILIGSLMYEGRIREVTATTVRLLAVARENGNAYWETELQTGQTLVWLAKDAPDEAIRRADEGIARWSHEGFHRQHYNHVLAHVQTELYRGHPHRAWQLLEEKWPTIRRSLMRRIQWTRIEASYWRARCALLMASAGGGGRRFVSLARAEARYIRRERVPWADPVASLLGAAVARLDGDVVAPRSLLAEAIEGFDRAGMALHAAVARRRFSEVVDDERSSEYRRQSDAWMASEGIGNPGRITRLVAPGFADSPEPD